MGYSEREFSLGTVPLALPQVSMAKAKFSPFYRRLCRLLAEARKKAGLQQTDVAKRLGRPQSYVSKVESGERRLDVAEYVEIAQVMGTDPVKMLKRAMSGSSAA